MELLDRQVIKAEGLYQLLLVKGLILHSVLVVLVVLVEAHLYQVPLVQMLLGMVLVVAEVVIMLMVVPGLVV
jgi:hypothetical protein